MSPNNSPPQHPDNPSSAIGSEPKEHDLERLQSEVTEVVQKIHHCRTTLPDQLRQTLHSVLAAQRPIMPISDPASTDPATSANPNPDAERHDGVSLGEEDKETAEKIQLLRQRILCNVSAMPVLLKRMKECISRIDDYNSHSRTIHPAFKKRRTS